MSDESKYTTIRLSVEHPDGELEIVLRWPTDLNDGQVRDGIAIAAKSMTSLFEEKK